MNSNQVCAGCGSSQWEIESHERVCTTCGDVQENYSSDQLLCSIPDHEAALESNKNKVFDTNQRLTSRIRGEAQSSDNKKSVNCEKTLDEMRRKVRQLIKDPNAVEETMNLASKVIKTCTKRLFSEKKLGLAGACIYFVSSKYKLGLTLTSICKALGIRLKIISCCLKQVKELCPDFEFERPNIKDLATKFIDELASKHCDISCLNQQSDGTRVANLDESTQIPFIASEDRLVLQNRVLLLVDLFEATHPYNQPNPQTLIIAVIYHAWRSLDTFKMIAGNISSNFNQAEEVSCSNTTTNCVKTSQLRKVKHLIGYERFCSLFGLKYSSNGYRVVRELQDSLLTLGRRFGNVTKLNLPWYLNDIIDNSSVLIKEQQNVPDHSDDKSKDSFTNDCPYLTIDESAK